MTAEIWKDITGYEGRYAISNFGNVKNIKTNYKRTPVRQPSGFYGIYLDTKTHFIHSLVAKHFINNPYNAKRLEHIDGNKSNNHMNNLCWKHALISKKVKKVEKIYKEIKGEKWKDIKNHDIYMVSNMGRIKNKKTNHILKQQIKSDGYYTVGLHEVNKKHKPYKVHRLVANHFIENKDPSKCIFVDHIDNDKLNNKSTNLRWVTPSENSQYYMDNHRKPFIKPILQYDKEMNFIKEWQSILEEI
jgi:hypothetical protein